MVGSRFCELSRYELIKADLNGKISVDITEKNSVDNFFNSYVFDVLILFSAFTEVDAAEQQRGDKLSSCWQINVKGAENIAQACKRYNKKLIFISTDFVFDGTSGPNSEEDKVGPNLKKVSWYGITKIEAEKSIKKILKEFIIIRISYPYRGVFKEKDDITKRILKLYDENKLYPMFDDQQITPTFIDDIAPAVEVLLTRNETGTYHLSSEQTVTQFIFAQRILSKFKRESKKLKRASAIEFLKTKNSTPRPVLGGMKVDKIKKLGFTPTNWQDGLEIVYEQSGGNLI